MSSDTITRIIKSTYSKRYKLDSYALSPKSMNYLAVREYVSNIPLMFQFVRNTWLQITSILMVLCMGILTIYYYNVLVESEQQVLTAQGKISVLMQRRNDISINLSKAVLDYSKHEQAVLTGIVALRTLLAGGEKDKEIDTALGTIKGADNPPATPTETPATGKTPGQTATPQLDPASFSLLGKSLLAVAEQYPDLKLSLNFSSLMTALIDVEKDLATERLKFNDAVNTYTTHVAKFPSNVYAALFKFPPQTYFEATEEARQLVPISY